MRCVSPWYNRTGWLGVKHQLTYLLTYWKQKIIQFLNSLTFLTSWIFLILIFWFFLSSRNSLLLIFPPVVTLMSVFCFCFFVFLNLNRSADWIKVAEKRNQRCRRTWFNGGVGERKCEFKPACPSICGLIKPLVYWINCYIIQFCGSWKLSVSLADSVLFNTDTQQKKCVVC